MTTPVTPETPETPETVTNVVAKVEPTLSDAAAQTMHQIAQGIDYTETFTLKQAYDSFNATRQDLKTPKGEVVLTAEKQRLSLELGYFAEKQGAFKLRRPGFYDEMALRVRYCEITRNQTVDMYTANLAEATAVCETLLVDAPAWFKLDEMGQDTTPLMLVYHWYTEWNARFRQAR